MNRQYVDDFLILVIQRAFDRPRAALENVGVDHGGLHILVFEQFPYRTNIISGF